MADISDVESVLVGLISSYLYPNGTAQASAITAPCRIGRGWPIQKQLDADLASGVVTVSVFPQNGMEQNVTRFPREPKVRDRVAKTLTAAISGRAITFGGTAFTPCNVAVLVGSQAWTYAVQPADTPTTIAAALAALINAAVPATSSGAVLTIPTGGALQVRIGGTGSLWTELRRQWRGVQVTIWAARPDLRDAAAAAIDPILADTPWLTLPDGSAGRLIYQRSMTLDNAERDGLYRRDLLYRVEYPTTRIDTAFEIIAVTENQQVGTDPTVAPIRVINV